MRRRPHMANSPTFPRRPSSLRESYCAEWRFTEPWMLWKVRDRKESGSQYSKFGNACPKRHYDATRSTLDIHRSCPTCGTTPGPLLSIPEQRDRGRVTSRFSRGLHLSRNGLPTRLDFGS
ncbi:hypothetical protein SNOG_03853 [Parastagonospora nodorum SN15]|uniref:Uncharacterized protein n=1 Tax=Phaeosphaeria nodorum (strain SN15 / ATCC MYA-4574 / FGSC 10173) TaxID=321614 RepID=Q0UWL1_PHANO|nr:hypothetical protein SNOG_03853 [Parastagonospora nodorum SN15]EAT89058.1 hypothetical protein SNOG_03853 [Parastagonospora nodorum SN15]